MKQTSIYLIRHAHAEWREDDDRPLSAEGHKAAALVADRLAPLPIGAIYTSPSRRSRETIEPLAMRLGKTPHVVPDLRERALPVVPPDAFEALVRQAWDFPNHAPTGGESNIDAQARGLAVLEDVVARRAGSHAVVATHGNLLALILNGLDPRYGHAFWSQQTFPDIYRLTMEGRALLSVDRLWIP